MTTQKHERAEVRRVGDREMRTERVFNASLARVWQAYTDPKLVAQWWGRGNELIVERMELERGGHWRYVEHTPHGVFGFEGRYREIVPMKSISQTFEWDGDPGHVVVQTATFQDLGGGRTKVVVDAMFFTHEDREAMMSSGMEEGLNQSYAALDRLLAR